MDGAVVGPVGELVGLPEGDCVVAVGGPLAPSELTGDLVGVIGEAVGDHESNLLVGPRVGANVTAVGVIEGLTVFVVGETVGGG
jgi:hypothetical protein